MMRMGRPRRSPLGWHGSTTLHYALKPGYIETDSFKVLLDGSTDVMQYVKQEAGYSLTSVEGDITVTVQGVADVTAPDVELSLSNVDWKQFFNKVPFGLFFRDDVDKPTATARASDDGSGLGQGPCF